MSFEPAALKQDASRLTTRSASVLSVISIVAIASTTLGCNSFCLASIIAVVTLPVLLAYLHGSQPCKVTRHARILWISTEVKGNDTAIEHQEVCLGNGVLGDLRNCVSHPAHPQKRQVSCFSGCYGMLIDSIVKILRPEVKPVHAADLPEKVCAAPLPAWLDKSLYVSGPTTLPVSKWTPKLRSALAQLKGELAATGGQEFERHKAFGVFNDCDLGRFLLARNCDVEAATKMIKQTLKWRSKRMPYWLVTDSQSEVARSFENHARAGKNLVKGCDVLGRGILILDGSAENSIDVPDNMRFLAYNVEAARYSCAEGVDKLCVICNLENLSILNSPPTSSVLETAEILQTVFPESLGTCIMWQPPQYFEVLYGMVRPLLDARTKKKVHVVRGDTSPGTENDLLMSGLFGAGWRESLGLGLPRLERVYSDFFRREIDAGRGYVHASYWPTVLERDRERAAKMPPWSFPSSFALDKSCWDGAYADYWAANLSSG